MKILIVDDEPVFLEQLNSIIQEYGGARAAGNPVVKESYSAVEALEIIPEFQPDLILTDIRMAAMDGIEFSKTVHCHWPETIVVIISGYSSFRYAREALRVNVTDYLLKPIDPKTVFALLGDVETQVRNAKYRKLKEALQNMMDRNESANRSALELIDESFDYYSLFFIQPSDSFVDPSIPHFHDMHEQRFLNEAFRQLGMISIWVFMSPFRQGFVVIAGRRRLQQPDTDAIIRVITNYFSVEGLPLSLVYLPEVDSMARLNPILKEMRNALYARMIIGTPQTFQFTEQGVEAHWNEPGDQQMCESKIHLAIARRYWGTLRQEMNRLFRIWKQAQSPNILVENSIKKIIRAICKTARQNAVTVKRLENGAEEIVITSRSFEEASSAVWDMINHELKLERDPVGAEDSNEDKFRQIDAYLQANLHEPITVTQLCEYFGLSTTKLYHLFRNYGKASFVEYFSALRINRAKKLMNDHPDMLTKDVAELVGYQDQHYFSRVFKNMTGRTPTEYRESIGVNTT